MALNEDSLVLNARFRYKWPDRFNRTCSAIDYSEKEDLDISSLVSVSEKLDAMIRFMEATGRMKDFYDIYYLTITFPFDGKNIQDAIFNTLSKRKTSYEKDSVQVIERLITNDAIQTRWLVFCRIVLKYELSLSEVIMLIISFIDPPFQAMINKETFSKNWNAEKRKYE